MPSKQKSVTPSIPRYLQTVFLILAFFLSACSGGSDSPIPAAPDNQIPQTGQPTIEQPDDSQPNNNPDQNALLSHQGVKSPTGSATPQNSSYFSTIGKAQAANLDEPLAIVFEVIYNSGRGAGVPCKALEGHYAACSLVNLHLKDSDGVLNDGNWKLYFHSFRRILEVNNSEFDIYRINGDLHYMTPSANFHSTSDETVKTMALVAEYNFIHETDVLPRFWLVRDGQAPVVLPNTDSSTDVDGYVVQITGENRKLEASDNNPVADSANRYDRYNDTDSVTSVADLILPTPTSVAVGTKVFDLQGGISFDDSVLARASSESIVKRFQLFYTGTGEITAIGTSINPALASGQYHLRIDSSGISISGYNAEAVFNGAQSLISLITPGNSSIPYIDVVDSPRFEYRGMHVDVARNFQSLDTMKKLMDQMAAYKLNRLHLHLSDDEGWRLEIPSLPELANIGGTRKFEVNSNGDPIELNGLMPQLGSGPGSNNLGSGHYSRSQFIELLAYASDRFIEVIPSMDMPAHARAAVVAMRVRAVNSGNANDTDIRIDDPADQSRYLTIQHYDDNIINPCVSGTYHFFQSVVTDVKAMYNEAGAPLNIWHMGGDEANSIFESAGFQDINDPDKVSWKGDIDQSVQDNPWERSPACQALMSSDGSINSLDDLAGHFLKRIAQIVANAGIESLFGWHEIANHVSPGDLATQRAGVSYWETINVDNGGRLGYELADRGFDTVLAVPDYLYLNFAHEADPDERGKYWGTRYLDTRRIFSFSPENLPQNAETGVTKLGKSFTSSGVASSSQFMGMQGNLWTELVSQPDMFDFHVFPRLLAVAERAWHKGAWERDYAPGISYSKNSNLVNQNLYDIEWRRFAHAVGRKEMPKLDASGIKYRIPTAGAIIENGRLEMNTEFPGLPLEHSQNGRDFHVYNSASPPGSATAVRAKAATTTRKGRATPLP